MVTQQGTITVNAAFLREVKEDNAHLRELLTAVANVLAEPLPRRIRPKALAELLGRLRDQLATHFSLEEFFGYFDDALDVAPHLSERADVLRAEHGELFMQLCGIVEQCEKQSKSSKNSLLQKRQKKHKHFFQKSTKQLIKLQKIM